MEVMAKSPPVSTQRNTTLCDRKSVQEVSKQDALGSGEPKSSGPGASSGKAASRASGKTEAVGRTHVNYWRQRLFRNSYTRDGKRYLVREWSVKMQHLGQRKNFSLGTTSKEVAANKAREVFLRVLGQGWAAAEAEFNPDMVVHKDDPTLGDFFEEVAAKSGLKPKTLRNYLTSFRTIASGSFQFEDDPSKYDYRSGGRQAWIKKVDAIKLSALTPERVHAWKVAHIRGVGSSPIAVGSAKRTVNSYLRCARSLLAPRILKFINLRLPSPLPFDGVDLEKIGIVRYVSKIKPELLVAAAKQDLALQHPESYKAFLLALFCGLRRAEIDFLEWQAIDWPHHRIWIGTTEHFSVKTDDSEDFVEVDPEVLAELRVFMAGSQTPFVINSHLPAHSDSDRQFYRCGPVFRQLTGWLRGKGIAANKPLHELRKEFGSLVNQKFGIYAASRALRHGDISTSTRHYVGKKERVTVGLGHLLAQAGHSIVASEKSKTPAAA